MMVIEPTDNTPPDGDPPAGKLRGSRPRVAIVAAFAAIVLLLLGTVPPWWYLADQHREPYATLFLGPAYGAVCADGLQCAHLSYRGRWIDNGVRWQDEVARFKRFHVMGTTALVTSLVTVALLAVALVAMFDRRRRPRLAEAVRGAALLAAIFGTAAFVEPPTFPGRSPWLGGDSPDEFTLRVGPGFPLMLAGTVAALVAAAGLSGRRRKKVATTSEVLGERSADDVRIAPMDSEGPDR